jgi:hypothetical protein
LQILKGAESAKNARMPKRSCKFLAKFCFPILRNGNQEVANLVMKTEFRDVFDGGHIVGGTCRATFGMFCENSFLEEWSALVDDFRTFVTSCDLDNRR